MTNPKNIEKNLEKLPSGSYRYRKYINGKTIRITFDHKPDDAEIALALAKELNFVDKKVGKQTFEVCCEKYLTMKDNVLSPSTKKGYRSVMKSISRHLMSMDVSEISQITIQNEINVHSASHSPKTTANVHGFISAVLSMFRPDLTLNTTLPQKVRYESYVPSEAEVKAILSEVENTKYSIAFQLGVLGLRRSEICALDPKSDLDGNNLSITKAKVKNEHEHWEIKQLTKTENGKRVIFIPDNLVEKIHEAGTIFDGDPTTLLKRLHKAQRKLSLPTFRFHDLRAFYASYCHAQGVPDAMIMESGGWKSDYVMKSIYRKALTDEKIRYQETIANRLL